MNRRGLRVSLGALVGVLLVAAGPWLLLVGAALAGLYLGLRPAVLHVIVHVREHHGPPA